jgi:hypothetical protein
MLSVSPGQLVFGRFGCRTLELLVAVQPMDELSAEAVRDACCYMAGSMQGNICLVAVSGDGVRSR